MNAYGSQCDKDSGTSSHQELPPVNIDVINKALQPSPHKVPSNGRSNDKRDAYHHHKLPGEHIHYIADGSAQHFAYAYFFDTLHCHERSQSV